MRILVLDTIHGGNAIGEAFSQRGDPVDCVDVYRGESIVDITTALTKEYDLITAPVHLDPDHPLLKFSPAPVISHHEAVYLLAGEDRPEPMIEITGARGKTTTAHALASLMGGKGILHTSTGTYRFPEKKLISKSSITPGSLIAAIKMARETGGWLIAEESLGVTGIGLLSLITSSTDYFFAAGKKSALLTKVASTKKSKYCLLAENIEEVDRENVFHIEDIASCDSNECCLTFKGKTARFSNPLLLLPGYHTPLILAAAAAMILGINPEPLSSFTAIPGRMSVSYENGLLIIDNANSGTNIASTVEAAQYARNNTKNLSLTLGIGQEDGDGAVCEGFSYDQIRTAISLINPSRTIWVGPFPEKKISIPDQLAPEISARAATLEEAYEIALQSTDTGSIILSVKTWR
jgi:folylpolyglutamate synthase/dihydropteroate synthase